MGFASVGEDVVVSKRVEIPDPSRISFGSHVRVDAFVTITTGTCGFVRIGSYVHLADRVRLVGIEGINIGSFVGLASNVSVLSSSDDYSGHHLVGPLVPAVSRDTKRGVVTVSDYVVVGSGSVVMPGSHLGEGVAVGACSFVNRTLPPWGVYFGLPVKFIKRRSQELLKFAVDGESGASR